MSVQHLALLPREGYFFKDGRGWSLAGGAGRTDGYEWPFPSTLRGALRSAHGLACLTRAGRSWSREDWRTRTESVRVDALLGLRRRLGQVIWTTAERVWPAPADALVYAGERAARVLRLQPRPRPAEIGLLGCDDDPAREALDLALRDEGAGKPWPAAPHWWPEHDFAAWLAEQPVATLSQPLRLPARLEVHVAIDAGRQTAAEAQLFTTRRTETLERAWSADGQRGPARPPVYEWGLGVRAHLPDDWAVTCVPLGADRRPAFVQVLEPALFAAPEVLRRAWATQSCPGLRVLLVSPGDFAGWAPPGFISDGQHYRGELPGLPGVEWRLRAACVPRPVTVSGWDMAADRPKAARRLVPSGSVYFFTKASGAAVTWLEAEALWLAAWGHGIDEGFGRVVPARWTPENGS